MVAYFKPPIWATTPPDSSTYALKGLPSTAQVRGRTMNDKVKQRYSDSEEDEEEGGSKFALKSTLSTTDDTSLDGSSNTYRLRRRCITVGSDPNNDIVDPTMPLNAMAMASHRNGKLQLYVFPGNEVEVDGEMWEMGKFSPIQTPCEITIGGPDGTSSFSVVGESLSLREILNARAYDSGDSGEDASVVKRNTAINRGTKRPRDESPCGEEEVLRNAATDNRRRRTCETQSSQTLVRFASAVEVNSADGRSSTRTNTTVCSVST